MNIFAKKFKLKICHFISSQGLGRGEFYIDLVNRMSRNIDNEIYLLVPKNSKFKHRLERNINLIEYTSKDTRNNILLYLELYIVFKRNSFDIVHTHFAKSSEIFYRLNKILNMIHIATKHNPRKGKIFNKLRYVTAVSIDVANSINNKHHIEVINNGIVPINISNDTKNEIFTIRAIGRLDKIKGFDILINEFSKIKNEAILEIVGDGDEFKSLQKIIEDLKLQNKVKLIGFKENIPELISTSDMIIMSSHSEGFSLVMVESIFYAKLFVSTKVSGCKEILSSDLLIENFDISNKLDDIIENYDSYCDKFQKISQKYKSEFNLDNCVEKYLDFYKKVLKIENSSN